MLIREMLLTPLAIIKQNLSVLAHFVWRMLSIPST